MQLKLLQPKQSEARHGYILAIRTALTSPMSARQFLYALDCWRSKNFFLKSGYVSKPRPDYFTDEPEDNITWQPDVYPFAANLANKFGSKQIVDIGCGRALKLVKLYEQHPEWKFTGLDYGANISWCRENWRFGTWIEANLEYGRTQPTRKLIVENAIMICSDVIEHLINPIPLLLLVSKLLHRGAVAVIFSTPERDLTRGKTDTGPPGNPSHVREWNLEEFRALLEWAGFRLMHLGLTRTNDAGPHEKTILVVATLARTLATRLNQRKMDELESGNVFTYGSTSCGP